MKRESKFNSSEAEEEEETSWQDSYSDLMTDLLAIFVVLFSFAMMSQSFAAAKATSGLKSDAVTGVLVAEQILPSGNDMMDSKDNTISTQDSVNSLVESIDAYIDDAGLSEKLSVTDQGNNLILLRASSSVFFDTGLADLRSDAKPIISNISEILAEYANSIKMIRIEGHTDNRPINTRQFDSNWELSTSRAVNVLRQLLELSQIRADKFSAVGYGEFHPIADNNTESGMAQNRRVDFIIEALDK